MAKLTYFAYGSNMLASRLAARCKSAKVVGNALAEGFSLEFSKPSIDGSGKGHLVKSDEGNTSQPGVLFEIDISELLELDRVEGAGKGYRREECFECRNSANELIHAITYLGTERNVTLKPYDWYLALIVAGARENGFDAGDVDKLLSFARMEDANPDRPTRLEACGLILGAGYESPAHALEPGAVPGEKR
ncbi:gamma-glutamylcyclotransferase family protein [Sinorhizobium medicae]|uniref:gamma-glutamylcyclotransferase family protein n=1 Tax=Sinorhizobium medicae TaxID=110321 RepID=UPI001AAE85B2|nr:gamma-glutamylcyclotransferase family protein [Sinorhizobium medicae]MBO1963877.1 gamma-glutamylcyclotransferase [Sinorhizobium medicae]